MEITESFLQEALDSLKRDILSSMHVAIPGNIVFYDDAAGTATIQPALRRRTPSGEILTAPPLLDVPVFRPSSDFAISAGDPCLLLFMDFCIDGWLESNQPVIPPSARLHDLSDAVALVLYRS